jgi:hypothetical protein
MIPICWQSEKLRLLSQKYCLLGCHVDMALPDNITMNMAFSVVSKQGKFFTVWLDDPQTTRKVTLVKGVLSDVKPKIKVTPVNNVVLLFGTSCLGQSGLRVLYSLGMVYQRGNINVSELVEVHKPSPFGMGAKTGRVAA